MLSIKQRVECKLVLLTSSWPSCVVLDRPIESHLPAPCASRATCRLSCVPH